MGNNKNPDLKRPGEKEPGKFHFNPGNMSGKDAVAKEDGAQSTENNEQAHPDPKGK